jgi:hypothetical protein
MSRAPIKHRPIFQRFRQDFEDKSKIMFSLAEMEPYPTRLSKGAPENH